MRDAISDEIKDAIRDGMYEMRIWDVARGCGAVISDLFLLVLEWNRLFNMQNFCYYRYEIISIISVNFDSFNIV